MSTFINLDNTNNSSTCMQGEGTASADIDSASPTDYNFETKSAIPVVETLIEDEDSCSLFTCSHCKAQVLRVYVLYCLHPMCFACLKEALVTKDRECSACKIIDMSFTEDCLNGMTQYRKYIETFVEREDKLNNLGVVCMVCHLKSVIKAAFYLCFECKESLCENCAENHCNTKFTYNHQTSIFELTDERVSKLRASILEEPLSVQCLKHPKQDLTHYCKDCYEIICVECIASDHSKHSFSLTNKAHTWQRNQLLKKQKKISKEMENLQRAKTLQTSNLVQKAADKNNFLEAAKNKWFEAKQQLDIQYERALVMVELQNIRYNDLNESIQQFELKVNEHLKVNNTFCSPDIDCLQALSAGFDLSERLVNLKKQCAQLSTQVENSLKYKDSVVLNHAFDLEKMPLFLFSDTQTEQEKSTSTETTAAAMSRSKKKDIPPRFKASKEIQKDIEELSQNGKDVELKDVKASNHRDETLSSSTSSTKTSDSQQSIQSKVLISKNLVIPKLEAMFRMDVYLKTDIAPPFITAMVAYGQKIIIADSANNKLKTFDMDGKCEAEIPADSPLGLSHCGSRLFYCDDKNQIIMVNKDTLETQRVEKISTANAHPLVGINVTRLFVGNGKSIKSMKWDTKIKGVKCEEDICIHGQDKKAIKRILSLAVAAVDIVKDSIKSKELLYAVSDWGTKTVAILNETGSITATYTEEGNFSPTGVFFSKTQKEIFVIDNTGNRLLLLDMDGNCVQQWSTYPAVMQPMTGCINGSGNLFLGGADQYIHIYSLQYGNN